MRQVCIWLGKKDFERLQKLALREGRSMYACIKMVVLRELNEKIPIKKSFYELLNEKH